MNPRVKRFAAGALALIAVVALGRCEHRRPFAGLGSDYGATVNSSSTVTPDTIPVSISAGDQVHWKTSPAGHKLSIKFLASDFPKEAGGEPPFPGPNGVDLKLYSSGGVIYTGPPNANLKPLFEKNQNLLLEYTYHQTYDGTSTDGKIIIKW